VLLYQLFYYGVARGHRITGGAMLEFG
jgi:hypothetical protein